MQLQWLHVPVSFTQACPTTAALAYVVSLARAGWSVIACICTAGHRRSKLSAAAYCHSHDAVGTAGFRVYPVVSNHSCAGAAEGSFYRTFAQSRQTWRLSVAGA